jgi:hypothetical protein
MNDLMRLPWSVIGGGSFGRKMNAMKDLLAPKEKPIKSGWNVPVNNC